MNKTPALFSPSKRRLIKAQQWPWHAVAWCFLFSFNAAQANPLTASTNPTRDSVVVFNEAPRSKRAGSFILWKSRY